MSIRCTTKFLGMFDGLWGEGDTRECIHRSFSRLAADSFHFVQRIYQKVGFGFQRVENCISFLIMRLQLIFFFDLPSHREDKTYLPLWEGQPSRKE